MYICVNYSQSYVPPSTFRNSKHTVNSKIPLQFESMCEVRALLFGRCLSLGFCASYLSTLATEE